MDDTYVPVCAALHKVASDADATAQSIFNILDAHLIAAPVPADGDTDIALTGYFEPEFDGALEPDARYPVPIYAVPDDLVPADPVMRATASDAPLAVRRAPDGTRTVYPDRAAIEQGALVERARPIAYLRDAIDAFVLHVQGSGVVHCPDGTLVRLSFAAKNGHPYRSVGQEMIRRGLMPVDGMTLERMLAWLRAAPEDVCRSLLWHNPSFIFFERIEGTAPLGAAGVPLIPCRSLAVDASIHTLGMPFFIKADG
ncbi:MAG: MltA domain-containing protein, partial [Pseudomonadota bacterium]